MYVDYFVVSDSVCSNTACLLVKCKWQWLFQRLQYQALEISF
jgi:hypothetical protein